MKATLRAGTFVNVCAGWCCGSNGPVDFVDVKGKRALVNFGSGRNGGLTWVPFKWLRRADGSEIPGCAKLRSTSARKEP